MGDTGLTVWNSPSGPVLLLVVLFMIAVLYYTAPNAKLPKFQWVSPGSLLAVAMWILASALFALYVAELRLLQQDLRDARRHRDPADLDLAHRISRSCSARS